MKQPHQWVESHHHQLLHFSIPLWNLKSNEDQQQNQNPLTFWSL